MTVRWQLRQTTCNRKLGDMATVTLSRSTCPPSCPLRGGGCYAESGPLRLHWDAVSDGRRGSEGWSELGTALVAWSKANPRRMIRIGDAGQITDEQGDVPGPIMRALRTIGPRRAIVYVHPTRGYWRRRASTLKAYGVALNVSREGIVPWDPVVPQVTVVPRGTFAEGRRRVGDVVQCPAEYCDTDCARCKLCALPSRRCVVGFSAHGAQARKAEQACAGSP